MKTCSNSKCNKNNPQLLAQFYKNKGNKDGLHHICKACVSIHNAEYHKTHKDERLQYHKNYAKTPEGAVAGKNGRKAYSKTEKGKEAQRRYRKSPEGKVSVANTHKRYRQTSNGKAKHKAIQAKRRAVKLKATPPWLNKDLLLEIQCIYVKAEQLTLETGIIHHVDHIFPLQAANDKGERIGSGMHVPWNLQILTQHDNCSKNNKIITKL